MKNICMILFIMLTGCTSITQPPTIKLSSVISNIKNDLQTTDSIAVNNYSTWSVDQKVKFDEIVSEQQCQAKSSDPLISILNDSFALNLSGGFTKSGSFGISTSPSGNISGTLSKTSTQTLNVPVNFVPLSDLPDFELRKKLTLESEILTGIKADEAIAKTEEENLLNERKWFKEHIQILIDSYSDKYCLSNNYNNNSSFVSIKPIKKGS